MFLGLKVCVGSCGHRQWHFCTVRMLIAKHAFVLTLLVAMPRLPLAEGRAARLINALKAISTWDYATVQVQLYTGEQFWNTNLEICAGVLKFGLQQPHEDRCEQHNVCSMPSVKV